MVYKLDAWVIFITIFAIALIIIIIASLRKKKGKKTPLKTVDTYLRYGDYLSAGKLYLLDKRHSEAADLYYQMPPEKRPSYEEMIRQNLGQQGAQFFWVKTGRRFERTAPEKAQIAFLLANAYFDAIKMYIDSDNSEKAISLIGSIPPNLQEGTIRRLSQYAFNRAKYSIAGDLLRVIGHADEADAVLAVAAHEFGAIEHPQIAADIYDSVGRQDLAGKSQERQGEIALSEGRIEEAQKAFEKAVQAYDESNQPKDALRVEEHLKKFELLTTFREYITQGNVDYAEDMLDSISSNFPGIAISDLYAEIASVLEKNGRVTEAITYYDKAADSTNNPLKRQSYVNALRRIGSEIAMQPSQGEKIAAKDLSEKCIVCKRNILKGENYISCPYCKKLAHYAHLIEFIKVQGSCPNCHKRLRIDEL